MLAVSQNNHHERLFLLGWEFLLFKTGDLFFTEEKPFLTYRHTQDFHYSENTDFVSLSNQAFFILD